MDKQAFEQLVERSGPKLLEYLRLSLPSLSDAQDVYQESLLSAWQSCHRYDGRAQPTTWLIAIAKRRIADFYRSRTAAEPLDETTPQSADFTGSVDLKTTLEKLSPADQRLLFLIFQVGLTYQEIADLEDIPLGTVKSRFHTLKNRLRTMLEEPNASRA